MRINPITYNAYRANSMPASVQNFVNHSATPAFGAKVIIDIKTFPDTIKGLRKDKSLDKFISFLKVLREHYKDNKDLTLRLGTVDATDDLFTVGFHLWCQNLEVVCSTSKGTCFSPLNYVYAHKLHKPRIQQKVINYIDEKIRSINRLNL